MYDPALGRFLGPDPQNQFASPYVGMGNSPVIMVDPDGEFVVVGMALLGAYLWTSLNEESLNPTKWAWDGGTVRDLLLGGAMGALGGGILANGGSAFVGLSNAIGKVGATVTMKGLAGAGYASGGLMLGSLAWETTAGGSGDLALGSTPDPIANTYQPQQGLSDEAFNNILTRKYGGAPGNIEAGPILSPTQYEAFYGDKLTLAEHLDLSLHTPGASGAIQPDYTIESFVIGGTITRGIGLIRGGAQTYRTVGAAGRGFSRNSFKTVSSSFLKKHGIKDIHAFKQEYLGRRAILKHFDVVRHTETGELIIIRKSTQEIVEYTGTFIK